MDTQHALDNTRRIAADAMERASEKVRGLRTGASDYANRGMSSLAGGASTAQRQLGEYSRATTRYVGEHPLKSAVIAAAVGAAVAGIVIALRRHQRSDEI
ncbi:glycine zipper domain-containing protein [Ramlibacter sp.]|uniref:glycine zipper domain-containing protein n=1 Tax=Ramlibacter sp. TaxID=1917967 RepID=UPI003D129A93